MLNFEWERRLGRNLESGKQRSEGCCRRADIEPETPGKDIEHRVWRLGIDGEFRFDEGDHLSEGLPQNGVVLPDFVEVTAWVVLLPELLRQNL